MEFTDAKGRFKVLFPGKPIQSGDSPSTFVLGNDSGVYAISYTDGHEGADWAQTVNSERDATIQGLSGKEKGQSRSVGASDLPKFLRIRPKKVL